MTHQVRTEANSQSLLKSIFHPINSQASEIRLAVLEPAPSWGEPIVCELQVMQLQDPINYEAVSWTWGDPNETETIMLSGNEFQIPQRLSEALRCFRFTDRSRTLWVDALSINQGVSAEALEERGSQVQLMKYIYSFASHVIIWLGLSNNNVGYLFENDRINFLLESWRQDPHQMAVSLIELLSRPWWKRLWVLQEALLPHHASAFVGNDSFRFRPVMANMRKLYRAARWETHADFGQRDTFFGPFIQALYKAVWTFDRLTPIDRNLKLEASDHGPRNRVRDRRRLFDFMDLMSTCRFQLTSDPRDKVFGLLGLADVTIANLLQPRYDESIADSYLRITTSIIQGSDSLRVLEIAFPSQRNPEMRDLPSWVPDWSVELNDFERLWMAKQKYIDARNRTVADADSVFTHFPDSRTLHVVGVCVDTVTLRSSRYPPSLTRHECQDFLTRDWDQTLHEYIITSKSGKRHKDELLTSPSTSSRTATHIVRKINDSQYHHQHPLGMLDYVGGGSILSAYRDVLLQGTMYVPAVDRQALKKLTPEMFERLDFESDQEWNDYVERMQNHILDSVMNRSLFVTTDGFIGSSQHVEKGDKVFVLQGLHFPVIMRPLARPQHYKFMGCCFVSGIMDAEPWFHPNASIRQRQQGTGRRNKLLKKLFTSRKDEAPSIKEDVYIE